MGKEYQKRTKAVILRTLIMKYNISVKVIAIILIEKSISVRFGDKELFTIIAQNSKLLLDNSINNL